MICNVLVFFLFNCIVVNDLNFGMFKENFLNIFIFVMKMEVIFV